MIKMIVTDLDQTLLRTEKYISDYTVDVLKKCQNKGIKVVFATARSTQSAARFVKQFPPDVFIGYGGALVLARGQVIYRFGIPGDISNSLINACLQEPDISTVLAINESVAYTSQQAAIAMSDSSHYKYHQLLGNDGTSYLKISLIANNPQVVLGIAQRYPMCDLLQYTGEDLYRFANKEAVKWNALGAVASYYNIDTQDIVAFGDDINDLEMIAKCGIGVAVANAVPEVVAVAKYVCATNDNDGVAQWLEERVV